MTRVTPQLSRRPSWGGALQPDDHVYANDLVEIRRLRSLAEDNIALRNINEVVAIFDEEVTVLGIVGVEVRLRALDRNLSQ
jgi:hypothetical protein